MLGMTTYGMVAALNCWEPEALGGEDVLPGFSLPLAGVLR